MTRLTLGPKMIDALDFGAPAAERDIERGLGKCFVESGIYHRVRSGAKTLVLGNRGAGKSAIFQVLARRERAGGSHVLELSPEDYSYELLGSTVAAEKAGSWAKHGAYTAAWKYLLYILIMKELARKSMQLKKGAGAEVYKYLRDNHAEVQMGKLALLISYLKRIESIKLGPVKATIKTRELDKLYRLEEIHALLPALKRVLDTNRVVVLVDELDRGWDSSEDAQSFVAGLFQACVSVNSLHRNLRVYVSLRQELYDDIPSLYEDAQKYRDLLETIHWTDDGLLNLIARRIRYSAKAAGYSAEAFEQQDDLTCWAAVFGAGRLQARDSFDYLVARTLYRPREAIQYCSMMLEAARNRGARIPLPLAAVTWAERHYSAERARDIAAEYRFQYPGLLSVFDVFRGRDVEFLRDDLELLCLELATGEIPTKETARWLPDCEPDELIEILWNVGFLKAQPVGSTESGNDGRGSFLGSHQVQHLNLAAVRHFAVHEMFHAYLGARGT